jgi:hypothetical protein
MMASVVLAGLLYSIVELYLDDVLVYATSEDELIIERLCTVFTRLRQFNITLNPKKCSFGMQEVEFVVHILKTDGVHFSSEKRSKVLDFPLPEKQKQLKSFLGLVNYYCRDHVEGLSVLTKPLNDLTTPYRKSSSIVWTPQLEELFKQTQEAVGNCPKLYYVDNDLLIHVRTDASDYWIAGYIFQKDGHTELPIRLISKSLHK